MTAPAPNHVTIDGTPRSLAGVPADRTLLAWLREDLGLPATKEGCAEGDCGACSVLLVDADQEGPATLRAVDSCILPAASLAGRTVFTARGLADGQGPSAALHPAQKAMVDRLGSQCGYCTPGIVTSIAEAAHRPELAADAQPEGSSRLALINDQLSGNLCRCTGYRPIREAALNVAGTCPKDGPHAACMRAPDLVAPVAHTTDDGAFIAPTTLDALFEARAAHPDAPLIAGGTDLGLTITKRGARYPVLIGLERLAELRVLTENADGSLVIGAGVKLADVEAFARGHGTHTAAGTSRLPVLSRMLRYFASRQIKNKATLGGNLVNASPIGDMAPVLLALGASLELAGPAGRRTVPLDTFFTGYRQTVLAADEVVVVVHIPPRAEGTLLSAFKVSRRREMDISAVAAGMMVRVADGVIAEARLAFGGMAATPARARATEAALLGQPLSEDTMRAMADVIAGDFAPITDHRATDWYRMRVAQNLLVGFAYEHSQCPTADGQPVLGDMPSSTIAEGVYAMDALEA